MREPTRLYADVVNAEHFSVRLLMQRVLDQTSSRDAVSVAQEIFDATPPRLIATVKDRWNTTARAALRVIAELCTRLNGEPDKKGRPRARSKYRDMYEERRKVTADRVHARECPQCLKDGRIGGPWRDGHKHADALRYVIKYGILKDLWLESQRLRAEAT